MEMITEADIRQRVIKWIDEGQFLAGLLRGLLEENEKLKAGVKSVEKECEQLRQENGELRKEQEELVGGIGKLMAELVRPMNELMQKIRGTQKRSPFGREPSMLSQTESSPLDPEGPAKQ